MTNYYWVLALLVIASCTEKPNKFAFTGLKKVGRLELTLDKKTNPITEAIAYYSGNEKEYIAYQNSYNNSIQFYDIKTKKKDYEVFLDEEGPDGVGIIKGFYVQTLDSIYITTRGRKVVYLVNLSGKVINSYNYNLTKEGHQVASVFYSMSNGNTQLVLKENMLLLSVGPGGNYAGGTSLSLDTIKSFIKINTKTKEVEGIGKSVFPKNYWSEAPYWPAFSRTFDGNTFAYSFWYSDSIYTTKDHKTYNSFAISSNNLKKWRKRPKAFNDIFEMVRYGVNNALIEMLVFDPYRDIYYVVVYLGAEINSSDDPMMTFRNRSPHSIVILNSSFEKIGEDRLELNRYKIDNYFVGEKGLYISENNEFNPDFDENRLRFTLFSPQFLK